MSTPSYPKLPFSKLMPFAAIGAATSPMQAMLRTVSAVSRTTQTAGIEWADFARQSLDHGTITLRKLAKARDPRSALTIQAEFLKGSYERIGAQTKLLGELYTGLAGDLTRDSRRSAPAPQPITKV